MANKPLSREFLLNRGYCCGNGCLNCPYKTKNMNIQEEINKLENKGHLSDGYHTFDELYEFRKVYNAALFNEWCRDWRLNDAPVADFNAHKSWRHNDGELCFGGGWFIVVALLPTGQISNHYEAKDWDLFKIPETEKALFPFDNHTAQDVLNRLKSLNQ